MAEPLPDALAALRDLLLDDHGLIRAIASGRRPGERPAWRRVDLRYVDLKTGRHLQVTSNDDRQAHTANISVGEPAAAAVDGLLAEPFGDWRVETLTEARQVRVTKRGAVVHRTPLTGDPEAPSRVHDRAKAHLLPEDDPVLRAVGIADARGRIKPSRRAKYRQVEEFLRDLDAALDDARSSGRLRTPTSEDPLRIVDLGCGNAYLTFAADRHLTAGRGLAVTLIGIDVKEQAHRRNTAIARELGVDDRVTFVRGEIDTVELDEAPDVVLALHACDTATDDALARAVAWRAPLVLAAPCCHRDVARQLRRAPTPFPALTRDGILRERFADTLTDALRSAILRLVGYRVEVVEFVDSRHTPRNTLLRAVRTDAPPSPQAREELAALLGTWGVRPKLADLLGVDPSPPDASTP